MRCVLLGMLEVLGMLGFGCASSSLRLRLGTRRRLGGDEGKEMREGGREGGASKKSAPLVVSAYIRYVLYRIPISVVVVPRGSRTHVHLDKISIAVSVNCTLCRGGGSGLPHVRV